MQRSWRYHVGLVALVAIFTLTALWGGVSSAAAINATYYVDCLAATNGNGSQATPWNRLSSVNGTTFGPGDTILFKRGTTCTGQLWPKGSGSAGQPITIGAYGTAAAAPIIDGNNAVDIVVKLYNQEYWVIQNLEVKNSTSKGIFVDGDGSKLLSYFRLSDLIVHGMPTNNRNGVAVWLGFYQRQSVNDVVVDHITAYNAYRGIEIGGDCCLKRATASQNVTIRNSRVSDVANDGIFVASANGVLVENNVAYNTGYETAIASSSHTPNAIWNWDTNNARFRFNEAYDNKSPSIDGGAFDIDYFSENTTYEYNYGHDNQGYLIAVFGADAYTTTNSIVRYNIGAYNARDSYYKDYEMGDIFLSVWNNGAIQDTQIYNNTTYWAPAKNTYYAFAMIKAGTGSEAIRNTNFKNNLIYSESPNLVGVTAFMSETHLDNNLYWYAGGNPNFRWGNSNYTGFANWQAASGQDAHSIFADPMLNTPTYHSIGRPLTAFNLSAGSPAINAGADMGNMGSQDFFGNPIPSGGAYDIGAHEYQNNTITVTPSNTPTITNTPTATWTPASNAIPQIAGARAVVLDPDDASWYGGSRSNLTCRSIQRVFFGGGAIRVRLSNYNGSGPLTLNKVYAGIRTSGASTSSNVQATFGGAASVTIPVGQQVYSDKINLPVNANQDVAVSFYISGTAPTKWAIGWPDDISVSSYCTAWVNGGDHAADTANTSFVNTLTSNKGNGPMQILTAVDVYSNNPTGAVVILGDSISAGTASMGRDGYNRWSEVLSSRLLQSSNPKPVANLAVSGDTCQIAKTWVLPLLSRLDRDALSQSYVSHVIVNIGTNDYASGVTAPELESCLLRIRDQVRYSGAKMVVGTIIPYTGYISAVRTEVNDWIRANATTEFDGMVDFDLAIRDPNTPYNILPAYNSGDNIHPNAAGHAAMANAINLALLNGLPGTPGPTYTPTKTATPTQTYAPNINQLSNPGFETGTVSPWWFGSAASITSVASNVYSGVYSAQIGSGSGLAVWPTASLNTNYTYSAWCKAEAGQTGNLYAKIQGGSDFGTATVSSTSWQKVTVNFNRGAAAGNLELGFWRTAGAGNIYCDDFFFGLPGSGATSTFTPTSTVVPSTFTPIPTSTVVPPTFTPTPTSTVVSPTFTPTSAQTGTMLDRTGWTASASKNSPGAVFALDGQKSSTSAWYAGVAQAAGQWFQVDMKSVRTFNQIVLNQEFYTTNYPRGYQVFVSNDGVNWGTAVATGSGTSGNATTITFATQNARYIRVTLTSAATSWWFITEFYVYAP